MACNYSTVKNGDFERLLESDYDRETAFHQHLAACDHCQHRADALFSENASSLVCLPSLREQAEIGKGVESDFQFAPDWQPAAEYELKSVGRYEIQREIGRGGMGQVFLAADLELQRVVALKTLAPHLAGSGPARQRFAREAQAAAAVLHPNVLPIHDVNADEDLPYLVMQYVPGTSLQNRVEKSGPLGIADVLRIATQTASALHAAHQQGLIHRDVKPSNILLENDTDRAVLGDFGLARTVDEASVTQTGIVAGTPHYMSPEQAEGEAITQQSDQFALGSCIYFMLAGRPPFRADSAMGILHCVCKKTHTPIQHLNSEVPLELSRLVDRLLSKRRDSRFRDCEQVARELERMLSLLQQGRLRLGTSKRVSKPLVLTAMFIAVFCSVVFVFYRGNGFLGTDAPDAIGELPGTSTQPTPEDETGGIPLPFAQPSPSFQEVAGNDSSWLGELNMLETQLEELEGDSGEPTFEQLLETQIPIKDDPFDSALSELEKEIENF